MSDETENLGLTLPDATDFYDINVTNTNMNIIDDAVGTISQTCAKESSLQNLITTVGTTTDTGGTSTTGTVMAKLNALQSGSTEIYVPFNVSGIPLLNAPVTWSISGAGRLYGLYVALFPNYNTYATLGKVNFSLQIDNETILADTAYRTTSSSSGYSSIHLFGTTNLLTHYYNSRDYYFLQIVDLSTTRYYKLPVNLYGPATETLISSAPVDHLSFITNPIKFTEGITATFSAEDYDCESNSTVAGVYILD